MKLFARYFIASAFLLFCFCFLASSAFALTTPFRSAKTVTSDGNIPYTSLENCSATDGQTCNRTLAVSYANLYFKNFGTYNDFEIPQGSTITKVRIRVTGKTSYAYYVGLSLQMPATSNCQFPSDLWTGYLGDSAIKVQNFVTDVTQSGIGAVGAYCLQPYNFENNMVWRINYSSSPAWSANIDNFEIAFDYNPPATPTSTPTPTPTPTTTPIPTSIPTPASNKIPLILIPGIMGSELETAEEIPWVEDNDHGFSFVHTYPANEKVWVNNLEAIKPGNDDYFDILRMDKTGGLSMANLTLTGNLVAYDDAIKFFTSDGYTLNQDFFVFPYDWRKDISLTAPFLDEKIESIKAKTGKTKVDIVAHSMGGLVARNYISDPGRAAKVRKLFTLGTPHLGSVDFLKTLRYGTCLKYPIGSFCLTIESSEVKDIIQNMISAFELAPTQRYYKFYSGEDVNHPYPFNDSGDIDSNGVTGVLDYLQTKTLLDKLGHNAALFYSAETFHKLDDNLTNTNGVEIYNIAGSGLPTVGQLIEKSATDIFGNKVSKKDETFINGDETVPLMSAALIDYGKSLSLLGDAKVFYSKQNHGDLVASGSALLLVRNILNENDIFPDGISMTPYNFKGTIISGHSPINVNVYDSSGNHTGFVSGEEIEQNIPGSFYDTLDDAKFIYLPDEGQYVVKIQATDQGSFDLKIRKYQNSENTNTILYENVPLTVNTKAELALNTLSSSDPVLQVDEDGDGSFEKQIYPGGLSSTSISTTASGTGGSSSNSTNASSTNSNQDNQATTVATMVPTTDPKSEGEDVNASSISKKVAGAKTFEPAVVNKVKNKKMNGLIKATIILVGLFIIVKSLTVFGKTGRK